MGWLEYITLQQLLLCTSSKHYKLLLDTVFKITIPYEKFFPVNTCDHQEPILFYTRLYRASHKEVYTYDFLLLALLSTDYFESFHL